MYQTAIVAIQLYSWVKEGTGVYPGRIDVMVKILANGEIVPDNDPRAQASASTSASSTTRRKNSSETTSKPRTENSNVASTSTEGENVIVGDLARMLGVHGKSQEVMGRDVPLIYLIVAAVLAVLWFTGNTTAIRMMVFGLLLYVMYTQYMKGQTGGSGTAGNGEDNSSRGHVINPGR
eukprot:symbB.v1.2.015862.t1/scaffold1196.1/size132245/6